ncbi:MAG: EAL domain-containing protein (putative c-di-GMP-specific phosphodiesterase class I) [Sulfurimonas sp.]
MGGDEFTVVLEDVDESCTVKIAQKILTLMRKKVIIENTNIHTTFSIGISRYPEDGMTSDVLLRNADTAMYKAKEMGKNQYQFYNEGMTQLAMQKSKTEADLRLALENDEFIPYYQPKIDALNHTVIGMEALIRWQHPNLGLVMPGNFISVAEDTMLILPIDRWMMKETIEQLMKWKKEGIHTGQLSINLSMKQLEDENCIHNLKQLTKDLDNNIKNLELEITESQIMKNPELSIKLLTQIRELGITISIDDFGTGYSSLSYLKRLPIDRLKIDRSFIVDLPHDENDVAIVRAIIALAKSLKLSLIAEGVETKEQLDFLVEEGCPNIQGYYYSKPIPADKYREFLKKYQ